MSSPQAHLMPTYLAGGAEGVTFHVFNRDGSRKQEVLQSFLSKRTLSVDDVITGYIKNEQKDDHHYTLVLEGNVTAALRRQPEVFCIISFQKRASGYYAVCRVHRAKELSRRAGV